MRFLPPNVGAIVNAASKADTKYAITGVSYSELPDGRYELAATDTRILAVITGPSIPAGDSGHPCTPKLASAPNSGTAAIIPADTFAAMLKASPAQRKAAKRAPALASTGVVVGTSEFCSPSGQYLPAPVTFGKSDGAAEVIATHDAIVGRFPPFKDVIPSGRPVVRVKFAIELLQRLLSAAEAIGDTVIVDIMDDKGEKPVLMRNSKYATKNGELTEQTFMGLVMPLSMADDEKLPK
jgi:hypothetical protein